MSDLVIAEEDGWMEISDLVREIPMDAQKRLWEFVRKWNARDAADLLEMEVGGPIEDMFGTKPIQGVRVVSVPDDILGERLRIWVNFGGMKEGK